MEGPVEDREKWKGRTVKVEESVCLGIRSQSNKAEWRDY